MEANGGSSWSGLRSIALLICLLGSAAAAEQRRPLVPTTALAATSLTAFDPSFAAQRRMWRYQVLWGELSTAGLFASREELDRRLTVLRDLGRRVAQDGVTEKRGVLLAQTVAHLLAGDHGRAWRDSKLALAEEGMGEDAQRSVLLHLLHAVSSDLVAETQTTRVIDGETHEDVRPPGFPGTGPLTAEERTALEQVAARHFERYRTLTDGTDDPYRHHPLVICAKIRLLADEESEDWPRLREVLAATGRTDPWFFVFAHRGLAIATGAHTEAMLCSNLLAGRLTDSWRDWGTWSQAVVARMHEAGCQVDKLRREGPSLVIRFTPGARAVEAGDWLTEGLPDILRAELVRGEEGIDIRLAVAEPWAVATPRTGRRASYSSDWQKAQKHVYARYLTPRRGDPEVASRERAYFSRTIGDRETELRWTQFYSVEQVDIDTSFPSLAEALTAAEDKQQIDYDILWERIEIEQVDDAWRLVGRLSHVVARDLQPDEQMLGYWRRPLDELRGKRE